MIPVCTACDRAHWYPRAICPFCAGDKVEWREASGKGTIYTFSVMRRVKEPYIIAHVTLAEGPTMLTNVVDATETCGSASPSPSCSRRPTTGRRCRCSSRQFESPRVPATLPHNTTMERPNAIWTVRQRHGPPRRPGCGFGLGYKQFIDYNIEAETLGYHSTFLVEHHFSGAGQVSASLSLLTWLAAKTRTLRLGTAVLVLPWHNPVLLAEQAATIDLLSGGRLDFGVGKGYRHNEFSGFCIPIEEAEARFKRMPRHRDEILDLEGTLLASRQILELCRHHRRTADGAKAASADVDGRRQSQLDPPGGQRGYNLLLDQFASLETIGERVAWFKAEVEKRGRAFDPLEVGVARAFYVAKDKADKEAALEQRLAAQRHFAALSKAADGTQSKASIMAFSDTREASEEAALYGTPDEIASSSRSCKSSASNMCCSTVAVWRAKACGASPAS